jgi:hypothetical protein
LLLGLGVTAAGLLGAIWGAGRAIEVLMILGLIVFATGSGILIAAVLKGTHRMRAWIRDGELLVITWSALSNQELTFRELNRIALARFNRSTFTHLSIDLEANRDALLPTRRRYIDGLVFEMPSGRECISLPYAVEDLQHAGRALVASARKAGILRDGG